MRHDLFGASDKALARIFDLVCRSYARGTARKCVVPYCECLVSKGRWQLQCAMITEEDNDTPVQSQFERDKTVANDEGGSDRSSVGVKLPWCRLAPDHLASYIPNLSSFVYLQNRRKYHYERQRTKLHL